MLVHRLINKRSPPNDVFERTVFLVLSKVRLDCLYSIECRALVVDTLLNTSHGAPNRESLIFLVILFRTMHCKFPGMFASVILVFQSSFHGFAACALTVAVNSTRMFTFTFSFIFF